MSHPSTLVQRTAGPGLRTSTTNHNIPAHATVPTPRITFEDLHDREWERRPGGDRESDEQSEDRRLALDRAHAELQRARRMIQREREMDLEREERDPQARIQLIRYRHALEQQFVEDWQNWFPFELPQEHEINEVLIDWLKPMEFEERMDTLSDMAVPLTSLSNQARRRERELRSLSESFEDVRARRALESFADRLDHIRNHLRTHALAHYSLQVLYSSSTSEQSRLLIENGEDRLSLPVRSCFLGNYRVGFGNLQDYLERDPGLTDRAHRAELDGTSIAHLPAWELPNDDQNNLVHAPPPGWRSMISRTDAPPPVLRLRQNHRPRAPPAVWQERERAQQNDLVRRADEIMAATGSLEGMLHEFDFEVREMDVVDAQGSDDDADDEGDEMLESIQGY